MLSTLTCTDVHMQFGAWFFAFARACTPAHRCTHLLRTPYAACVHVHILVHVHVQVYVYVIVVYAHASACTNAYASTYLVDKLCLECKAIWDVRACVHVFVNARVYASARACVRVCVHLCGVHMDNHVFSCVIWGPVCAFPLIEKQCIHIRVCLHIGLACVWVYPPHSPRSPGT